MTREELIGAIWYASSGDRCEAEKMADEWIKKTGTVDQVHDLLVKHYGSVWRGIRARLAKIEESLKEPSPPEVLVHNSQASLW